MSTHAPFRDRRDAGRRLAALLEPYAAARPVVLALPRGGVPVGYEVARRLRAPLDVIVARKLGAPSQPELGVGAVAPGGILLLDERLVRALDLDDAEVEALARREQAEMERRLARYRGDAPPPDVAGRTVILVDDGLATGVTATAAARALRRQAPARLVLAAPVCARETAAALHAEVDDLVCVVLPERLVAVGAWYDHFEQTSDDEVLALLDAARAASTAAPGASPEAPT